LDSRFSASGLTASYDEGGCDFRLWHFGEKTRDELTWSGTKRTVDTGSPLHSGAPLE
jgi:hypothetical protein